MQQKKMRLFRGVLVLCVGAWAVSGCGDDGMTETSADTGGSTSQPMTTSSGTTTPDIPTTSGSTSDASTSDPTATTVVDPSTTGGTTLVEETTTGGQTGMCLPKEQDCDDGEKCNAYALMPGDEWNANACVPETGEGVQGDDCTVEGDDVFTGIDDCAKGYICLNADANTKQGTCVEFCSPTDECPNTSGGDGICLPDTNDGHLPICLQVCDPLIQDCPGNQGCYGDPSGPPFVCFIPDPQDNMGVEDDPCEFTNACVGGFHCAPTATQMGCDPMSFGCCTAFCNLDEMDPCAAPEQCVPFFPNPIPGYENVGICALPN